MNSSFSFKSSWCNSSYNSNCPMQNSWRGRELNKFFPTNRSDDLHLFSVIFIRLLWSYRSAAFRTLLVGVADDGGPHIGVGRHLVQPKGLHHLDGLTVHAALPLGSTENMVMLWLKVKIRLHSCCDWKSDLRCHWKSDLLSCHWKSDCAHSGLKLDCIHAVT